MKKVIAMVMLVMVLVGSAAFAEGIEYTEVESMIPEEETIWFKVAFEMSGDPELEEAPDPYKTYTVVGYIMKSDDDQKPGYLGLYDGVKIVDLASGYLVPEVVAETAEETINKIKEMVEFNMADVNNFRFEIYY